MKVVFRADASVTIGTGHVMRCLTLADELRRQGHECSFICREHEGHLAELINQKGFGLYLLPKPAPNNEPTCVEHCPAHADWLGATWQADAEQTLKILIGQNTDWLVVDHYALDAKWERRISAAVGQIMVIDDLADREHECAVLLDQNVLNSRLEAQYQTVVNNGCKLLLGPRFALLRPEYALLANAMPQRDGHISRVLVFVGGSDPHHLTERYLQALESPEFEQLSIGVVLGKNQLLSEQEQQIVARRPKARLYSSLPSLAALMVRADLMLGAGGTTNWERMCLGLNSIVASVARNQGDINRSLGVQNLITFVGNAENLDVEQIREAVRFLRENPEYIRGQSRAMRDVVDGFGAARVTQHLTDIWRHASA